MINTTHKGRSLLKKRLLDILVLSLVFIIVYYVSKQTIEAYYINGVYWSSPNSLTYFVDSTTINEGYKSYSSFVTAWNPSSKVQIAKSSTSTSNGTKTSIVSSNEVDLGGYYASAIKYKSDGSACQIGYHCLVYKGKITIMTKILKT
ncbi:hypothetical protein [Bacillus pinisoli]|uniref:hypothetical protein n=1 Tax=Bacillus pinisoli TaxID=2901866 RepID=UPI001FF0F1F7|nr:hypothetical protein [Bacillus pinisoli]